MRAAVWIAFVTWVGLALPAPAAEAPEPIAVFCHAAGAGGFVEPEVGDSTSDLVKILGTRKKTLRLVDSAELADVVVTVTGRGLVDTGARSYNTHTSGRRTTTSTSKKLAKVVDATLAVGTYQRKLRGASAGFWSSAAGELADQVEDWVKQNRPQILSARAAR